MAEKDITEKILADYNDVFADILNTLLFGGERVVKEEKLVNLKDKSMYKFDGKLHEQERDVIKALEGECIRIAVVGLEHETKAEKYMTLRVLGYDGSAYRAQLLDDTQKEMYPVVTLVLYFGLTPWLYGKTLYEEVDIPEIWQPYVSDYRINVFEIAFLDPETVKLFQSDFRHVADYLVQKRLNNDYIPSDQQIRHVDAVLKLMRYVADDVRFEEIANEMNENERKEGVKMCNVLDKIEARGEVRGEVKAYSNMGKSAEEIAGIMHKPVEVIKDILMSFAPQPSEQ